MQPVPNTRPQNLKRHGARPILPGLLFYNKFLTCNIQQTRTTLRHTIGTPERILSAPKALCPPRADLGVVPLHRDMVQRDTV